MGKELQRSELTPYQKQVVAINRVLSDSGWGADITLEALWAVVGKENPIDMVLATAVVGKQLRLNPLKREIIVCEFETGKKTIFVGKDGHLAQLHDSGRYVDHVYTWLNREGDELTDKKSAIINYDDLAGCVCTLRMKREIGLDIGNPNDPDNPMAHNIITHEGVALIDECDPEVTKRQNITNPKHPWKTRKKNQLKKCALSIVAKESGAAHGYDPAEMGGKGIENAKDITELATLMDDGYIPKNESFDRKTQDEISEKVDKKRAAVIFWEKEGSLYGYLNARVFFSNTADVYDFLVSCDWDTEIVDETIAKNWEPSISKSVALWFTHLDKSRESIFTICKQNDLNSEKIAKWQSENAHLIGVDEPSPEPVPEPKVDENGQTII